MKKLFLIFLPFLAMALSASSQPKLNSLPTAKATIYLDFDGHFVTGTLWNGGVSFYCAPSGMRDIQIENIFLRVSEDYRPFEINITTDSTVYLAAPLNQRMRMILTPTSAWYPGVGGVAFTGSFTWGDDTPAFVFTDRMGYSSKNVAECSSHESGHTLGLSHQAKYNGNCNLVSTYNDGTGTGETGWAPLMGNSYGRNLSGWNHGPTPYGCTEEQDNLSIITTKNGFSYREKDHSNDPRENPTRLEIKDALFSGHGVITTNTDEDAFGLYLPLKGNLTMTIDPFSVGENNAGANLDVMVSLLDASFNEIALYNPGDVLNVVIDTVLPAGKYYTVVKGAGNANTTNYGSLGSYSISGIFKTMSVLPINDVTISGKTVKDYHELNWQIISSSGVERVSVEMSEDGSVFKNISVLPGSEDHFRFVPQVAGTIYYRVKATDISGHSQYSNVVSLRSDIMATPAFTVINQHTGVVIRATERFQYQVTDLSGRMIKNGSGQAGTITIQLNNSAGGVYFLKVMGKTQTITKRILNM